MNNVKSSHDDGKPYRASEPVIPKRSQAKSSKAAEVHRLLYYINSYNLLVLFFSLSVRMGSFLEIIFGFSYTGWLYSLKLRDIFLLDNYPIYLGINTLLDIGRR